MGNTQECEETKKENSRCLPVQSSRNGQSSWDDGLCLCLLDSAGGEQHPGEESTFCTLTKTCPARRIHREHQSSRQQGRGQLNGGFGRKFTSCAC